MSRPMLLVFLLLILIITSQFEWRQPLVAEVDANQSSSQKIQLRISSREETVKEKIILSQEKTIQKLSELVRNLRQQLSECRGNTGSTNASLSNLTETIIELERQQFMNN